VLIQVSSDLDLLFLRDPTKQARYEDGSRCIYRNLVFSLFLQKIRL